MTTRPTLLFVHAHPDDEASLTGGTIARYAAEGARVVLVTCTNGELGDSPDGHVPGDDNHDTSAVVTHRLAELADSVAVLGIDRSILLGYHDSGMMGWEQNDAPDSFWQAPTEEVAARLAAIIDEEQVDVVVTYDEFGFYGHPDHIKANVITLAALEMATTTPKLYYATIAREAFERLRETMRAAGVEAPEREEGDESPEIGASEADIGAVIAVGDYVDQKRLALEAHRSQTAESFFLKLPVEVFRRVFTEEWYIRVQDPTGQVGVESDLVTRTA